MPPTVETGAIVSGANSYASIADADAYHAERGGAWTGTDAQKTAALLKATAYLDGKYRSRWKGYRVQPVTQALEWPRSSVEFDGYSFRNSYRAVASNYYPTNVIPPEIVAATCELAVRALAGPLAPDIAPGDRLVKKKIDVIEKEFAPGDFQTSYPVVEQLISRFLRSGNDAVRG